MAVISITCCSCLCTWVVSQKSMEMNVWKWDFCSRKTLDFFLFCFWKKKKKKVWTGIKSWYCKTNKIENTWEKESFLSEFQNKFTRTFLSLWCLYFKQRRKDWASQQRPQCQRVALYWEQGTQLSHPPKHPRSKSCTSAPHPEGKKRFRVSWDQTAIPAPGWNCWKENHLKIQKIITAEVHLHYQM